MTKLSPHRLLHDHHLLLFLHHTTCGRNEVVVTINPLGWHTTLSDPDSCPRHPSRHHTQQPPLGRAGSWQHRPFVHHLDRHPPSRLPPHFPLFDVEFARTVHRVEWYWLAFAIRYPGTDSDGAFGGRTRTVCPPSRLASRLPMFDVDSARTARNIVGSWLAPAPAATDNDTGRDLWVRAG